MSNLTTQNPYRWGILILLAVPALVFMAAAIRYNTNIPLYDDITQILWITNTFIEGHTNAGTPELVYPVQGRLHAIFYPNAGHVPMVTRLFALGQYYLFGKISFYYANLFCCAVWVISVALLLKYLRNEGMALYALIPVPFLFFSLSQWEAMTMMLGAIQIYIGTLFLPLLTLYAATRNRPLLTAVGYFFGLFASAGTLALLPILVIYFLLNKQWKNLCVFVVLAAVFTGIFYELNIFGRIQDTGGWLDNIPAKIHFVLLFLSNVLSDGSNTLELVSSMNRFHLAAGITIALAGLWGFLVCKKYVWLKMALVYLVLLAVMTSLKRTDLAPRYAIFALVTLGIIYILLHGWLEQARSGTAKYLCVAMTLIAMLLWSVNLVQSRKPFAFYQTMRYEDMKNYIITGDATRLMWDPPWCVDILNESKRLGVYDYTAL